MTHRRGLGVLAAGALVALVLLALVGRWEGRRHERAEVREIAAIRAEVPSLASPMPDAYRTFAAFSCLIYRRGANPYALELCIDPAGRVIEAYDRRGGKTRIASVRERPEASDVRVDPAEVHGILGRLGAFS